MANNIFQNQITPVKPKVLEGERIYVYVPTATKDIQGIASYNTRDFGVNNGHVSLIWPKQMLVEELSNPLTQVSNIKVLADEFVNTNNVASLTNPITGVTYNSNTAEVMLNRKNRDAFTRPDFVMLDNVADFETSTDAEGFVKYTLKRNNPLVQPSLIQIAPEDFIRKNSIVKINWDVAKNWVTEVDNKLNDVINNVTTIGKEDGSFATKNTETSEDYSIAIGDGAKAKYYNGMAIGKNADAGALGSTAIGNNSIANDGGFSVGRRSSSYGDYGLALGYNAQAWNATQIGEGFNSEYGTLQFRKYRIVEVDGKLKTNDGTESSPKMVSVASEDFVIKKITELINSAPETLDTLGEIAKALQENHTVVDTLNNIVATKPDKDYVDNVISNSVTSVLNTEV